MDHHCNSNDKENEDAALYKFWLFRKKFPRFVRYIVYLIHGAVLLLVPVLLGAFRFSPDEMLVGGTGGVELLWFGIWLEIVWCSLWLSRLVTSLMPHLFYSLARVGCSTNAKKWKYFGQQLELHTALFLWFLAMLVSFKRTNYGHRAPVPNGWEDEVNLGWIDIVNKVIIALFTLAVLNLAEKILIVWIATSFHQRAHSTRIVNNSAIKKLDKVFLVIIVVITAIVFISILSASAATGLVLAGTPFLGLSWMLQATAQEFMQSVVFVFIKHPFDVGDQVTIHGSTGADMTGDDYYVTEISLLYTEFKKLDGSHILHAPNSLLNTLFITRMNS